MNEKVVLVLDCGATNVRTVAVNQDGMIVAHHGVPNNTRPDPLLDGGKIWDVDEIWQKFMTTTREVAKQIPSKEIVAITVTTFGVDGAPFDMDGRMLYPVISWQCLRTEPAMRHINRYMPLETLYRISGVQPFSFNTIAKLIWLLEHHSQILDRTAMFLFLPSIFNYFLTGRMVNDATMAGTSMLTDLKKRGFSREIFSSLGLSPGLFSELVEPGSVVGPLQPKPAAHLGLPGGVPVVAAGHDTQFAIFGAGATEHIPVLSSGTWEILMVRAGSVNPNQDLLESGVTTELDPIPGLYNPGIQWIASGTLEWIARSFYPERTGKEGLYESMISEAASHPPGSNGVFVNPDFLNVSGGLNKGLLGGLHMDTPRGAIYRATLEALAFKTSRSLKMLEQTCSFKAPRMICVGGGSKNDLWNQIRADVLGLPVETIKQKETTVLGAAMFAFFGAGLFDTPQTAMASIHTRGTVFHPGRDQKSYQELAEAYGQIL
jgi:L-fuculokinase